MATQRPRLFVLDDERAVLSLAGTGMNCLDVLRALRRMSPPCEAVLMTGYESFDAALDALRRDSEPSLETEREPLQDQPGNLPAPLIDVQRQHIVRTLQLARGNKAVAARLLGVSRRAFYRQLERHGLHQRAPGARRGALEPSSEQRHGE